MARERDHGVFVVGSSLTVTHRVLLAELALKHRLPTIFGVRGNVVAGGLMNYGADHDDLNRRAAATSIKFSKAPNLVICPWSRHRNKTGEVPEGVVLRPAV